MFKGVAFCALLSCALASYDFASYYGYEMPEASKTAPVELPPPASAPLKEEPVKEALVAAPAPVKEVPVLPLYSKIPVYEYKAPSRCAKKIIAQPLKQEVQQAPSKIASAPAPALKKEESSQKLQQQEEAKPALKKEETAAKQSEKLEAASSAQQAEKKEDAAQPVYKKEASAPQPVLKEAPAGQKEELSAPKKEVDVLAKQQETFENKEASAFGQQQSIPKYGSIDYYAPPKYQFKYELDGFNAGDKQFHQEERDGHSTRGKYELKNPHGTLAMDYTVITKH